MRRADEHDPPSARGAGAATTARRRAATKGRQARPRVEAKTLAALVLAALLIAFAVANSQKVEVDFLVTTANVPLVMVILIAVLLGAVPGRLRALAQPPAGGPGGQAALAQIRGPRTRPGEPEARPVPPGQRSPLNYYVPGLVSFAWAA